MERRVGRGRQSTSLFARLLSRLDPGSDHAPREFAEKIRNCCITEVMWVSGLAFCLGIALSFSLNQYWFHDLGRLFKISRKFGQQNVWSFALNSPDIQWATVRDLEHNMMFQGYVRA